MGKKIKKVKMFPCEYCSERIASKTGHTCYKIEAQIRKKVKAEVKSEAIKTEMNTATRSLGLAGSVIGEKVCIEVEDDDEEVRARTRRELVQS